MLRTVSKGQGVTFTDPSGYDHDALVTEQWGNAGWDPSLPLVSPNWPPAINIVYVNSGGTECRETSVAHQSTTTAPGRHWRFRDEERAQMPAPAPTAA